LRTHGVISELLPDWYLGERETEVTIEKLSSLKELDYYINNTDEYVRRLAILRIKKLGLKESSRILKDVMDNPVESHANKHLAAWALKVLLVNSDNDYTMSNRYLANFTGHEKYEDLYSIASDKQLGSVRFRFSSSPYFSAFNISDEDTVLEKDVYFEADFEKKQWIYCLGSGIKANIRKILPYIVKLIKAFAIKLWSVLKAAPGLIIKSNRNGAEKATKKEKKSKSKKSNYVENSQLEQSALKNDNTDILNRMEYIGSSKNRVQIKTYNPNQHFDYNGMRKELYRGPSFFTFVKKGVYQLFYILLSPIRFAKKHTFAFICIIVSTYIFFAYYPYGRSITNKYAGFDLQEFQTRAFNEAGVFINRITGIDEWKENSKGRQVSNDILKTSDITSHNAQTTSKVTEFYTVSAKDGLNIRSEPDPSSEKVGTSSLPYGTSVLFISSAFSESAGIDWFYVEAEDGRIGWVSSKYLKKAGG
jgi:hypothetical protein